MTIALITDDILIIDNLSIFGNTSAISDKIEVKNNRAVAYIGSVEHGSKVLALYDDDNLVTHFMDEPFELSTVIIVENGIVGTLSTYPSEGGYRIKLIPWTSDSYTLFGDGWPYLQDTLLLRINGYLPNDEIAIDVFVRQWLKDERLRHVEELAFTMINVTDMKIQPLSTGQFFQVALNLEQTKVKEIS